MEIYRARKWTQDLLFSFHFLYIHNQLSLFPKNIQKNRSADPESNL
jgi:hypothetical protein